mgnify:CR=1 FL=1
MLDEEEPKLAELANERGTVILTGEDNLARSTDEWTTIY